AEPLTRLVFRHRLRPAQRESLRVVDTAILKDRKDPGIFDERGDDPRPRHARQMSETLQEPPVHPVRRYTTDERGADSKIRRPQLLQSAHRQRLAELLQHQLATQCPDRCRETTARERVLVHGLLPYREAQRSMGKRVFL